MHGASVNSEMLTSETSESTVPVCEDAAATTSAAAAPESDLISMPNQPQHQTSLLSYLVSESILFNSKWFDNDKWSSWLLALIYI